VEKRRVLKRRWGKRKKTKEKGREKGGTSIAGHGTNIK
jgi:hypothetical protein